MKLGKIEITHYWGFRKGLFFGVPPKFSKEGVSFGEGLFFGLLLNIDSMGFGGVLSLLSLFGVLLVVSPPSLQAAASVCPVRAPPNHQ